MMQQRMQKTRFLNVGHRESHKLPLFLRQAGVIIFQLTNIVYCNKLRTRETHDLQKHSNNPPPTPENDWFLKK